MVRFNQQNDSLTVYLEGEIDHHAANRLRVQIDTIIKRTDAHRLILDFSNVSFMDSSGIGMMIGRYKTMSERNGKMNALGLSPSVERIFRMAGLHLIIGAVHEEG